MENLSAGAISDSLANIEEIFIGNLQLEEIAFVGLLDERLTSLRSHLMENEPLVKSIDKILSVKKRYSNQKKKIKQHMVDIIAKWDDSALEDLEEDCYDYYLENFSISSDDQMEEETRCYCLTIMSDIIENCFMEYLKEERTLWEQFMQRKYVALSSYKKRHLATSLLSLKRALKKKNYLSQVIDTMINAWKQSLLTLEDKDSAKLLIALKKNKMLIDISYEKSKHNISDYMNLVKEKSLEDIYEIYSQSHDYFKKFSIPSDSYDNSPLADPKVAISFTRDFVSKKLLNIQKAAPSKRSNSAGDISELLDIKEMILKESPY